QTASGPAPSPSTPPYARRISASLQLPCCQFTRLPSNFGIQVKGNHPAGLVSPPLESVQSATSADLVRFHAAHYLPNNAIVAVVGDVTMAQLRPKIERAFGNWKRGEIPQTAIPAPPAPSAAKIHLIDRPGSVQAVIHLGDLSLERSGPDYFPVLVMDKIVGGGPAARLFMNLRENKGYTYGAYSVLTASKFRGVWEANAQVRTAVADGSMHEFMSELNRIRDERVSAAELDQIKRALVGTFALSLEQPQTLLQNIVTEKLYGFPADYWDQYPQRVSAVTAGDIQRVARKYVDLDHLQTVVVGDAAQLRAVLAKYGTVEAYDPEDKPVAGFTPQEKESFKKDIDQIAKKLIANATLKPTGIGWINITKAGKPEETLDMYNGDPGVCYFLLKAYAATGEKADLEAAKKGMAYILSQAKSDEKGLYFNQHLNGLFEGNAGPGYLFLYAHHVTGGKSYLKTAEDIAHRIVAAPEVGQDSSSDIISGAAGTGLFLLKMYQITNRPEYLQGAERLGDFIVDKAEPQERGVKWKVRGRGLEFYFVGFSHGPAGIGYYLDRLYRVSKNEKYRQYADKAMDYIEAIAIPEKNYVKWYHDEEARKTRFSSQWCHGAPGMDPFFLELYTRTKEPKYLDWADKNTKYLLDQGVNVRKNANVCHGISGNTAALYMMYEATGKPAYFDEIRNAVQLLDQTVQKQPDGFYWEALGYKPDYSYMTGLAGIGDFYVLLYSNGKLNMLGPLGYGDDL
ncbi:MAG: lanthionine synthetase LanC family protein, partial [Bryobacteraceae bacterium]